MLSDNEKSFEAPKFLPVDVFEEYSYSPLNQEARFALYAHAVPYIDTATLIRERLALNGDETILDVGCGSGKFLLSLREQGHRGDLIGIDISENPFYATTVITQQLGIEPIDFRVGDAHHLELDDSSVDVSMAIFMLYHTNPAQVLSELKRVTKPGGMIVIATSGPHNKVIHRLFESFIAEQLGYQQKQTFNRSFDSTKAAIMLPEFFSDDGILHVPYEGAIDLADRPDNQEVIEAFELSLVTMKSSMRPLNPEDPEVPPFESWQEALTKTWEIVREFISQGSLKDVTEYINRDYYFCRNDK